MATIHDCDGRLVTYCLSAFAYSVKSHPSNSKRSLQASIRSRMRWRSALTPNHVLPSSPLAAGSSGPPESNTVGLAVRTRRQPLRGTLILMVDPPLQPLVHGPYGLPLLSPPQPTPMLVEVVPSSSTPPGGITVSLFVNNLPQDGPIYARFGSTVVDTVGVQSN